MNGRGGSAAASAFAFAAFGSGRRARGRVGGVMVLPQEWNGPGGNSGAESPMGDRPFEPPTNWVKARFSLQGRRGAPSTYLPELRARTRSGREGPELGISGFAWGRSLDALEAGDDRPDGGPAMGRDVRIVG